MKSTHRSTRRIALAVCLSVSLLPQTAIPMPTELRGGAALNHSRGWSSLSAEDMAYLIGGGTHGSTYAQITQMTEEQMINAEGKALPAVMGVGAGVGALGGLAAGLGNAVATGNWAVGPILNSTASGAITGALAVIPGGAATFTVREAAVSGGAGFVGGAGGGFIETFWNWANAPSQGGGGGGSCSSCHATHTNQR